MIKLESLSIMIQPDPDFFATLRALPLLVDLHLFFLSPGTAPVVAASLAAKPSFRSLEVTMATANAWDEAELAMLRSCAEAAGVAFRYQATGTRFRQSENGQLCLGRVLRCPPNGASF